MLLLLLALATQAQAITRELYSTNAVCKQRRCVNPIFPGLGDVPELTKRRWTKHSLENVSRWMEFCGGIVDYDPALPLVHGSSLLERFMRSSVQEHGGLGVGGAHMASATEDAVRQLDNQALRTYFYHLSGVGIEAWDHTEPMQDSYHPLRPCARSVAKLSCYTYFPKATESLASGASVSYLRPCRNACESYVQACDVDCCDESVTCTWNEYGNETAKVTQDIHGGSVLLQTGYADQAGPALQCTGQA
mmetsp:Transcript_4662/g.10945  ORF Transcript_4662/g.10945 Transcript_4662/m.10945 type:complete len:248 (-) Transcript_4662:34-777(-)